MSRTSCLLVRTLSPYRLRARYRHSSFPPLYWAFKLTQYYLYKKRECGPHSTSWSYESPFKHSLSFREGNSMETSDIRSSFCSNFRSLTRLAMSQVFLWDGLLGLCPWSELGAFQPSLDFLFNSQLKSSKNSVFNSIHDRGIKLYTNRGATLPLIYFTSDPLARQRIMPRTQSAG